MTIANKVVTECSLGKHLLSLGTIFLQNGIEKPTV